MAFEKNEARQFPTKEEFLGDKKMDDRVYGYMQANSYLTDDKVRYCWKTDMSAKNIKAGLSEKRKETISENTIRNNLKLMQAANLIKEETINRKKAYVLIQLISGNYVFVKTKTLKYLVDTANENVIKIYAFLKQKQELHKKGKYDEQYCFTENKLLEVLGYASNETRNHSMIKNILDCLVNDELIKFHRHTKEVSGGKQVMYYFLDDVYDDYKTVFKDKQKKDDNSFMPVEVPRAKCTIEEMRSLVGF